MAFSGREKEATLLRNNLHKLGAANPVILSGAVGRGGAAMGLAAGARALGARLLRAAGAPAGFDAAVDVQ